MAQWGAMGGEFKKHQDNDNRPLTVAYTWRFAKHSRTLRQPCEIVGEGVPRPVDGFNCAFLECPLG